MIIERSISQLTVGSYVVSITKQRGKCKVSKLGWIRDFHAIEVLIHEGVLRVAIDTSKTPGEKTSPESVIEDHLCDVLTQENSPNHYAHESQVSHSITKPAKTFAEEFFEGQILFKKAKNLQAQLLDNIHQDKSIEVTGVKAFVDETLEVIFHNSDALLCVLSIRIKNEYLLEHSISVSILCAIFGCYLQIEDDLVRDLAVGAFLHDVGKIKISDTILNKPGKLTEKEFEIMKRHVVYSSEIIAQTSGLSKISQQVVSNHHEKLDGSGYPAGRQEEELDLYSRIIVICDIYDALTTDRVYKSGLAQTRALMVLRELALVGQLDVTLVDQFIKCLGVYPVGSLVQLSSDKLALVERKNENNPCEPLVKSFFNIKFNYFVDTKEVDLSSDSTQEIVQGVRAEDFDLDMNKITEFLMMKA